MTILEAIVAFLLVIFLTLIIAAIDKIMSDRLEKQQELIKRKENGKRDQ